MWGLVKKYWDLLSGFIVGLGLSIVSHFNSDIVRKIYSVIILILVCMGVFRFARQSIDKHVKRKKDNRKHNILDDFVDSNIAMKAICFAENPTKEGKKIKELINTLGGKQKMKKIKEFFDKFKGYLLAILLGVLTVVEYLGGFINGLFDGALVIGGVEVLPVVTLVCAILIGCISNGFTKEQMSKIKALFSKSSTNELVKAEIKKKLKDTTAQHTQFIKIQVTKETELENLNSELENLKNSYNAKVEMYRMIPQLATEEDVQLALNSVNECQNKIAATENEIKEIQARVDNLKTMISSLKNQL